MKYREESLQNRDKKLIRNKVVKELFISLLVFIQVFLIFIFVFKMNLDMVFKDVLSLLIFDFNKVDFFNILYVLITLSWVFFFVFKTYRFYLEMKDGIKVFVTDRILNIDLQGSRGNPYLEIMINRKRTKLFIDIEEYETFKKGNIVEIVFSKVNKVVFRVTRVGSNKYS